MSTVKVSPSPSNDNQPKLSSKIFNYSLLLIFIAIAVVIIVKKVHSIPPKISLSINSSTIHNTKQNTTKQYNKKLQRIQEVYFVKRLFGG